MILIITDKSDFSSFKVFEWLDFYKTSYIIVHDSMEFELLYVKMMSSGLDIKFKIDNTELSLSEIKAIWYRRGRFPFYNLKFARNQTELLKNQEYTTLYNFIINELHKKKYINFINIGTINKLNILQIATSVGLEIPDTYICKDTSCIEINNPHSERYITKAIFENRVEFNKKIRKIPLKRVTPHSTNFKIQSLVQREIPKLFEIRTFHFFGKNYSMAMFSQMNKSTSLDYRYYDLEKENRWVPFSLPHEIDYKLNQLMILSKHNTGSLDIIYSTDNRYVFLELNPIGQYDMVNICNYNIDKMIALKLIEFENND